MEELIGNTFLKKKLNDKGMPGTSVTECGREEYEMHEVQFVALYFGAYWCPVSRNYTKILSEFYNEINMFDKKMFEVIYVPMDQETFDDAYEEMPWMSFKPDDPIIQTLKKRYARSEDVV